MATYLLAGQLAAGLQPRRLGSATLCSAAGLVYEVLSSPSSQGCPFSCSFGSEGALYRLQCVLGMCEKFLSVSDGVSPHDLT